MPDCNIKSLFSLFKCINLKLHLNWFLFSIWISYDFQQVSSGEVRMYVFSSQIGTVCKWRTLKEAAMLLLLGGPLVASTCSAHRVCQMREHKQCSMWDGRMTRNARFTLSLFLWVTRREQSSLLWLHFLKVAFI